MTTLRVVVDQILAPVPGGIGRYTVELTRGLIATAPRGCDVEGVVAAHPQADYDRVDDLLPGLSGLAKAPLGRRELSLAWQSGLIGLPGRGMVHSTSLLAPLSRHDRSLEPSTQTVVTIHDTVPWTHPHTLTPRGVRWHKAMARRAHRFADAVVVPTHAVADDLAERFDFGDRLRVIGGAVSSDLAVPTDADSIADALDLPPAYCSSWAPTGGETSASPTSSRERGCRRVACAHSGSSRTPSSPSCCSAPPSSSSRVSPRDSGCPSSRR
jgi:glycosyltransferase involved in cell wall biosynthesis